MGNRRCDTILTQNRVAVTGFLGAYLGYRKALKVTNKEHAEARAQAIYDLIREGNYTALTELEKNRHVTFAQFLEKFRQDYHNWDEYTWKASSGLLSKLVKEFGDVPLNAITTHQLEGYLARRVDEGLKDSTRNRYVSALRTIFRKAKEWDYVTRDPAEPLKTKKTQQKPIKALSRDELEKLLKALPEDARQVAYWRPSPGCADPSSRGFVGDRTLAFCLTPYDPARYRVGRAQDTNAA